MQTVIIAGGKGTRLGLKDIPKPSTIPHKKFIERLFPAKIFLPMEREQNLKKKLESVLQMKKHSIK